MMPPRLLISVRCADEVAAAIDGGADIIDVKEPARGALGAADHATLASIEAAVAKRRMLSCALGEWHEAQTHLPPPEMQLDYVKIGLAQAHDDWRDVLTRMQQMLAPRKLAHVAYADHDRAAAPAPAQVLDFAIAQCARSARTDKQVMLIDTWGKDGRGLLHWQSAAQLTQLIEKAHAHGIDVALAGSLTLRDVPVCVATGADILAFRSAACTGSRRGGAVDQAAVAAIRQAISTCTAGAASPAD